MLAICSLEYQSGPQLGRWPMRRGHPNQSRDLDWSLPMQPSPRKLAHMAVDHVGLSVDELGQRAAGLVGEGAPPKMRAMVARGMAPLEPRDMIAALYHVWATDQGADGDAAAKTLAGLPDSVLLGALADRDLASVILDFLARRCSGRNAVVERVIRHARVLDDTLVAVARNCASDICEILADNQQRWLACPAIIVALYGNRNCRQSQVRRMLELADNQNVAVDLPMMGEVREAMREESRELAEESEERDAIFEAAVAECKVEGVEQVVEEELAQAAGAETEAEPAKEAPLNSQSLRGLRPSEKIRIALLGGKSERAVLVRDTNKTVAMATIKSPRLRDSEVVGFSSDRSLSIDVIRYISTRRDWVKLYAIKLNLVMNPKTPLAKAMSFLAHLGRKDVQKVARSRNIPSALAKAAKRRDQGSS